MHPPASISSAAMSVDVDGKPQSFASSIPLNGRLAARIQQPSLTPRLPPYPRASQLTPPQWCSSSLEGVPGLSPPSFILLCLLKGKWKAEEAKKKGLCSALHREKRQGWSGWMDRRRIPSAEIQIPPSDANRPSLHPSSFHLHIP